MKTAQADLTTGPLGKKIFRFSIPLIFSNLLQVLFNMADVAVFHDNLGFGNVRP